MSPEENNNLLEGIKNDPDNKNNLARLIEQLKRRAGVVPFVGAGLSMPFGFPGWGGFLTNQAERLNSEEKKQILEYIDQGKYEEAAEVLSTTPGYNFDKAIKETFSSERLVDKELRGAVSILPQLDTGPVVTTNFDGVLQKVFEQNGKQFERVVWGRESRSVTELLYERIPGPSIGPDDFGESRSVTELLYEGRRFLLKLHGDADDSTDRVLTKSEYQKQYGSEDAFPINLSLPLPHLLQAILKYRPLLFLGCSLNQDRTVRVLEQVSQQFQYIKPYAVVEKPKSEQRFRERALFLSSHNIRPIWYPEGKHGCIELLLKYLAEKSAFTVSQFLLSMMDQNLLSLRQPSPDNSTYLTSALPVLIGPARANTTYDFAVIDLGEGKEWVTSRLFIFAIILERFFDIRCFVFLETLQGAPEQFIGIASPDEVRWRLARKYPWLEEAFAKAYCSQMPSIKHFFNRQLYSSWPFEPRVPGIESLVKFFRQIDLVHSAGGPQVTNNLIESFRDLVNDFQKDEHIEPHDLKIESAHGALDPQLATPVALDFLRGIQEKDPPDKGGWVPLKWHDDGKDIERWERAQWLDKHLLEEILDASLQKDSWVPYDPPAGRAKAVLRREGRFIALVEGERGFKMLVDRRTFLEREVARLEVMDDEKPR